MRISTAWRVWNKSTAFGLVISSSSSSSSSSSQVPLGKVLEHSDRALALSEGRSVGVAVAAVHSVVAAALQTLVDQHLLLVV